MTMISYAQNREDVLLARCFSAKGFYVDVGAADPVGHSVTKWFSEQGWTGINVEPTRTFFRLIEADRPNDINLNVAVSDTPGELTFYEVEDLIGCSTLVPEVADELRQKGHTVLEYTVPLRTLAEIFSEFVPDDQTVEFLKVDVEGHEPAVLAGMDFRRWRPRVLVVEATRPGSADESHEAWEPLVLGADYRFAYFDGLNRYYVRAEDESLLAHFTRPACPFDDYVPYDQVHWEREAHAYQALVAARDRELEAKEADLLKRCREYDELHYQWRAGREEIESLSGQMFTTREDLDRTEGERLRTQDELLHAQGDLAATRESLSQVQSALAGTRDGWLQTQGELAAVQDELLRAQRDLANQRKALQAARAILAETRTHIDAVRSASLAVPQPHTHETLRCA